MRRALADRDLAGVFRILSAHGLAQRQIAAMTEQSQSEISEVLSGRRIIAYDVLARISDGLGVPRGYMGLAYDASTVEIVAGR
jgi:transcriptional regulator with XRE-family HTH domain